VVKRFAERPNPVPPLLFEGIVMSDEEFSGSVEFSVSAALTPWCDPGEFVQAVTGKAFFLNASGDEREAGAITLKLVSATEATNRGVRLYDICDADSAILESVYATLFDTNEEAKEELDIEPGWNNLLFVEDVEISREFEDTTLRIQLIETSMATLCPDGLIVAVEDSLDLTVEAWRRLGFKRIAASPFVFRDQMKVNPYQDPTEDESLEIGPDEASYVCDSCGEVIVVPLDVSAGSHQEYVEDCPICCRPNVVHVDIDRDGQARVWAEPEQDYD
jgi:hypothetical protein